MFISQSISPSFSSYKKEADIYVFFSISGVFEEDMKKQWKSAYAATTAETQGARYQSIPTTKQKEELR